MTSLACKLSHCLSANHYPELRCVICTGVTLFALVLHLSCTALSQSESSVISSVSCVLLDILVRRIGAFLLMLQYFSESLGSVIYINVQILWDISTPFPYNLHSTEYS